MTGKERPAWVAWLTFSVARIGVFAVVLVLLLWLLPVPPWVSAVLATVIAFCVSYIFLTKPRDEVSRTLAERRPSHREPTDDEYEDAADGGLRS